MNIKLVLDGLILLWVLQEKEAMEAAVRAFEDWEFRVLERESGIDDEDEDAAEEKEEESEAEVEREISCQQHVVNTTQVNYMTREGCCCVFRNFTAVRTDTQANKFTVCHVLHVTSEPRIIFHASIQICDRQASS